MSKTRERNKSIVVLVTLVMALVLSISRCAKAEETSLNFGGISYHMMSENTTTWFHRGLVVQHGDYMGGYLRNSYGQDSWMAAYKVWEEFSPTLHTELSLGAVRGYDKCYNKFTQEEVASGKKKVIACFLPLLTVTIMTDTAIQPQINLWGDAIVLTGKYKF